MKSMKQALAGLKTRMLPSVSTGKKKMSVGTRKKKWAGGDIEQTYTSE